MKAIQMSEQGGPEVLQLVELPDPQPRPGRGADQSGRGGGQLLRSDAPPR